MAVSSRLDIVTHTQRPIRVKRNTTAQGYSAQAHCTLVLLAHVRTVSLIHSFSSVTQARAACARTVKRESQHTRCAASHFSQVVRCVLPPPRSLFWHAYLYVDGMHAGSTRSVSSVSLLSGGFRDVSWERALRALPGPLLSALRAAELDDPGVLCEYPSLIKEELYAWLGEKLGEALSGATPSAQLSSSSWNSSTAIPMKSTIHSGSSCAATVLDGMVDSLVAVGGDPKTVHASFSAQMAATCSPYRPGGLATQTATFATSPVLVPVVCPISAHESEVRDGFPSFQQVPEHCDEFPCIPESSEDRDGFSRSGEMVDHAHLGETFTNSSSDAEPSFSRVFRDDEKSEGVRHSDSGVQNLPASVSSSELSAHQMSGALAGKVQITSIEPTGLEAGGSDGCSLFGLTSGITDAVESAEEIPSEQCGGSGTSAFVEVMPSEFLSISDRALLRRFGPMETEQKSISSIEVSRSQGSTSGSRVDGHPPNLSMNILDRALLRRFPDIPPSLSSSSGSAAVLASPPCRGVEETTKKRRFIGKVNAKKANISQNSCDSLQKHVRSDNLCGLVPKLAESTVHSTSLPSPLVSRCCSSRLCASVLHACERQCITCWLFTRIPVLGDASSSCCKEVADLGSLNHRFDGFHSSVCTSSRS